jgi:predicted phage tail protein
MRIKYLAVGAIICVALLTAAPAGFAQTPAQSGYSTPAGKVQQQLAPRAPRANARAASNDAGGLPFTGLDLGLVAVAGGMLLGIGLAVRRVSGSATR